MNTRQFFPAAALCAGLLFSGPARGQANAYRGLWVGEVKLNAVNEVAVGLDANNIPRAPDPNVPTPTFDTANLRLILHVNGAGQTKLLKQVAVLNRKSGQAKSENDIALVTDERLYGSFPPQAAQRIASVVFDFGDGKATSAVDAVVLAAATAAAASVNGGGTETAAKDAAAAAALAVINSSDAAERFATFLRDTLNSAAVNTIATSGTATVAQTNAATALSTGSFFQDSRGTDMIAAVIAAVTGMPNGTAAEIAARKKAAQNAAADYADVDNNYQRFLSGELFGDMIAAAATAAGTAAAAVPRKTITGYEAVDPVPPVKIVKVLSAAHGLVTGDRISLSGAGITAYNGVRAVTRISDDAFSLPGVVLVSGKTITNYEDTPALTPATVVAHGHGLQTGARITITGATNASYNGSFFATRIDGDSFSIPVAFVSDPPARGEWSVRSGAITSYEAAPAGGSGVKVSAPGHGLNNGEQIIITGAGAAVYNGTRTVTRIDANSFSIAVAFGGNPAVKGSWAVRNGIEEWRGPAVRPTTVTSTAHGLSTGDRITISGAGKAAYNTVQEVTVTGANTFTIPVTFVAADGNPATKGAWVPVVAGTWKKLAAIQTAASGNPKVNDARTEALRIKMTAYDDTRGTEAIDVIIALLTEAAANVDSTSKSEIATAAEAAGRAALADMVIRSTLPSITPTGDYTAFVRAVDARFTDYKEIAPLVAAAAAAAAYTEKTANVLFTATSVFNKAKEKAIAAVTSVYATAARAERNELPLAGGFGPGVTGLTGTILLPANHPTNPFRHRRHPDHTTGFDITRILTLGFDGAAGDSLGTAGYGVDRISGTYSEEIKGLHKLLGPNKSIGLKVRGTFTLQRISLIDTLNGR